MPATHLQSFRRAVVITTLLLGLGIAHAQDSAVYDAQQNVWKLYYQDPETSQWVSKTYEARTAIRPTIKSSITGNDTPFSYQYTVRNQRGAKQNISVTSIWGIPLVYTIPNFPPITANAKTDPETEDKQQWVQLSVEFFLKAAWSKHPRVRAPDCGSMKKKGKPVLSGHRG